MKNAKITITADCPTCEGERHLGVVARCAACNRRYAEEDLDWQADTMPCGHTFGCLQCNDVYCPFCDEGGRVTKEITLTELSELLKVHAVQDA